MSCDDDIEVGTPDHENYGPDHDHDHHDHHGHHGHRDQCHRPARVFDFCRNQTDPYAMFARPRFRGLDNAGCPLSGGRVKVYVAGTTTPKDTYTTPSLTVPNPDINSAPDDVKGKLNGLESESKAIVVVPGDAGSSLTPGDAGAKLYGIPKGEQPFGGVQRRSLWWGLGRSPS